MKTEPMPMFKSIHTETYERVPFEGLRERLTAKPPDENRTGG
jgi:hypothetical protein